MLQDIVFVEALPDYKLRLRFEDDVEGVLDVKELIEFKGVFEPFKDPVFFARVKVDEDLGTVCWENSADLDPQVLYAMVTGKELEKEILNFPVDNHLNAHNQIEVIRQQLLAVIAELSDEQLTSVLNYAEFLRYKTEIS